MREAERLCKEHSGVGEYDTVFRVVTCNNGVILKVNRPDCDSDNN